MNSSGNNSATAYVNDSKWTDIHYSVNNGAQQNVRMTQQEIRQHILLMD